MGGHWGTSGSASSASTVRASQVADALEKGTDPTGPSDRDAVIRRLSRAFPSATVRRGDGSTAHDVRVDDVRIVVAHSLDAALRRDIRSLADRFDELVVYSTTPHATSPNDWREFRYRHRGRHAGARIRFAHRGNSSTASRPSPLRAVVSIAVLMLAIGGLLAASLGLFGANGSGSVLAGVGNPTAASVIAFAIGTAVAVTVARRRVTVALLKRIPHT